MSEFVEYEKVTIRSAAIIIGAYATCVIIYMVTLIAIWHRADFLSMSIPQLLFTVWLPWLILLDLVTEQPAISLPGFLIAFSLLVTVFG